MTKSQAQMAVKICAALILGVVTGFLRSAGLDGGGLPFSIYWLVLLSGAVLLVLSAAFSSEDGALLTSPPVPYKAGMVVSSVLLAASAVYSLVSSEGSLGAMDIVNILFLAACAAAMILRLKAGEESQLSGLFSLFPIYYLCLQLLLFYRANAINPDPGVFGMEIMMIASMMVAVYLVASFKFEKYMGKRACFFGTFTLYLSAAEVVAVLLSPELMLQINGLSLNMFVVAIAFNVYICTCLLFPTVPCIFESEDTGGDDTGEDRPEELSAE